MRSLSRRRAAKLAALCSGVIGLACVSVFLFLPDVFLDGFLNRRIARALEEAYPAYSIRIAGLHYSILGNKLECDSIELMKIDSTFTCRLARFSVSGVGRVQLLWGGGVAPDNLISSNASAEDIVLTFPRPGYELRCGGLRVSVPDSQVVVDALEFRPLGDDERFFNRSKFSRTRFHLTVPHFLLKGSACISMLNGEIQYARIAEIQEPVLDVLIDNDKRTARDSVRLVMPNELLSSIARTIQLDSLIITDGQVKYGERYAAGSKPARLTFDHVQIRAAVSSSHRDSIRVGAEGSLMDAGRMKAVLLIPIASPEFTFQFSGSLGEMDLGALNPYLEIAEHKRFKTGVLHSVLFDIRVTEGVAGGSVRATYKDLKIVSINDEGSESGVGNTIVNVIANNMKLRTTNLPDEHGSMKVGTVRYSRMHSDAFFAFAWFALRSGLGDIVGI
ncbi:MAG TPA: hypothetical protein VI215_02765 [Bacteroidota bacterium]|jgi:hypothetical protein